MTDGAAIALRFGLYLDLMLLFGLAAYPLYAASPTPPARRRAALATLAALGVVVSIAGFAFMIAQMAGVAVADLDRDTVRFVVLETAPGSAFLARTVALIGAVVLVLVWTRRSGAWLVAATAGVALATLAWTGHAAVTEGSAGTLHRSADIIHLLAAGGWLGALAMLLRALLLPLDDEGVVARLQLALAGFAVAGSVLVALVVATGLVNGWMIVGLAGLPLLPGTLYGQLLIAKLVLFTAMLALAAANRWTLTPQLAAAQAANDIELAVRALRTSIMLEVGAAILILAVVAWLGTLAPPSVM